MKKGAFRGIYFRDIYCGINEKWYKKSWKEFDHLKDIDQKFYCSDYYDVSVNKYVEKIRVGLIKQILMVGFSGILGTGQVEDRKLMKGKLIDGKKL